MISFKRPLGLVFLHQERYLISKSLADDSTRTHLSPRSTLQAYPPFDTSSITVEIEPPQPRSVQLSQIDGPMDDPPLPRTKASSTPMKKLLRNGQRKLSFSPKKSPRRPFRSTKVEQKESSNGARKPIKPSKKVEVKKGKLVSSMRVTLPYAAPKFGARIDGILSVKGENGSMLPKVASNDLSTAKATHPFFMGKAAVKQQMKSDSKHEPSLLAPTSEDDANSRPSSNAPKAWKDIVFQAGKPPRQVGHPLPPIWPPISMQHLHPIENLRSFSIPAPPERTTSRARKYTLRINNEEDVLQKFSRILNDGARDAMMHIPTRKIMASDELAAIVDSGLVGYGDQRSQAHSLRSLKARVLSSRSFFDRGMAAGSQIWPQEYAPQSWQEVLEGQSKILHDWLSSLRTHQVHNGKPQKVKPLTPKKRRKRKSDEMDDFIAVSDDNDTDNQSSACGKNGILLVGPPGSGKTASVFAVAQQLGFEIFEIHPGMRRSARDIQDKVGEMTQNHLVQQSSSLSRESSNSVDHRAASTFGPPSANQKTMVSFVSNGQKGKKLEAVEAKNTKESKLKSQKQSLILFEEADILFDDDKGFWTHVQSLIRTTKRPVILTCNDIESVPLNELDLFAVLHYSRPGLGVAVQHLAYIAAAEGHIVSEETLRDLYLTKGQDLRASIMELNLWCQMTVGSHQGGLDWVPPYKDESKSASNKDGTITRIVSQDTYTSGLDLLPIAYEDSEDLFRFAQDSLDLPAIEWVKDRICTYALDDSLNLCDARSAMDLFDDTAAPILADAMERACNFRSAAMPISWQRDEAIRLYLNQLSQTHLTRTAVSLAFEPLRDESRIGLPTAPGRKASSLDTPSSLAIITDVAPYVRNIVSYDKRLKQLRDELQDSSSHQNGANKRPRRTRAARAAVEGGSKGSTRRDKWFPEQLDWDAVLKTGGSWPMFVDEDSGIEVSTSEMGSTAATPASSILTAPDVEIEGEV